MEGDTQETKKKKKQSSPVSHSNPNIAAARRAVAQSLAEEEAKRKANMSDAVKSLYEPANSSRKETFMTMGTFTRVSCVLFIVPVSLMHPTPSMLDSRRVLYAGLSYTHSL